jgi:hypothetical protein
LVLLGCTYCGTLGRQKDDFHLVWWSSVLPNVAFIFAIA